MCNILMLGLPCKSMTLGLCTALHKILLDAQESDSLKQSKRQCKSWDYINVYSSMMATIKYRPTVFYC